MSPPPAGTPIDWDARHRDRAVGHARAAEVLAWHTHLLPRAGDALDLACGQGANACVLARLGLHAQGWDASAVAVEQLAAFAETESLAVTAVQRDVEAHPPGPSSFDVIIVASFLHRPICAAIEAALRPGGLLFYQTFCRERLGDTGPRNPRFLLEPGELPTLFPGLRTLVYREEGRVGDPARGFRDRAMLVAQRLPQADD